MKKKVFSLLLTCALALSLAACGDAAATSSSESDANTASVESEDPGEADQVSDTADVAGASDSVETDGSADADGSGNSSDDVDSAIALNGPDSNSGSAGSSDSSSQSDPGSSGTPGELDSYWDGDYFDLFKYFKDNGFETGYVFANANYNVGYYEAKYPNGGFVFIYTYEFVFERNDNTSLSVPDDTCAMIDINSLDICIPGDRNDRIKIGKPGYEVTPQLSRTTISYLPKIIDQIKEKGNTVIEFEDIQ